MAGVKAFFSSLMDRGQPTVEESDLDSFKAACECMPSGRVSAALPCVPTVPGKDFQEHLSRKCAALMGCGNIDACCLPPADQQMTEDPVAFSASHRRSPLRRSAERMLVLAAKEESGGMLSGASCCI